MCELCERNDELRKELDFRFVHLQVEMMAQREGAAEAAEKRIYDLVDEIVINLKKHASVTLAAEDDLLITKLQ